jgi:threonine dehydrogenase-like Zn-dependent dehydrogenase
MKALVWHGPRQLAVEDVPDAQPGPGEVLLAPEACGICGSEVEGYGRSGGFRTPPLIMGHEFAGRVLAVGEGANPSWVGQRAAVNPLVADPAAPAGHENLGQGRQLLGVHRPGGFAGAVSVPESQLRRLPEGTDPRVGALAEPLANGVHSVGLGLAGRAPGEVGGTVVIGAGAIGAMVVQAAVAVGLPAVASVELDPARREIALALGAHSAHASGEDAKDALGGDVGLVIDAVGAPATRTLAISLLRDGGHAVMLGLAADEVPVGFHRVIRGELTLHGSYAYTHEEYDRALGWLLEGRAGLPELPPVEPLEAGPERFAELAAGPTPRVKVFLADRG